MVEAGEILVALCLIISFAICCWRLYLRVIVAKQYLAIELALLIALIMQIVMGATQLKIFELLRTASTPEDAEVIQEYFFAGTFFYLACLWNVKISINLLHIRLTEKFPHIHKWAVRSLWFMILSLPAAYAIFILGCLPVDRRWKATLGTVKSCPPIMREWDFWAHFALNIATDLWLCVLPFPALIQVKEKRLRFAVCGIYSLAFLVIIVSTTRIVLLGINAQANIKYITVLTMFELTTAVIVGSLPGISSVFTRKYVYGKGNTITQNTSSKTSRVQHQRIQVDRTWAELDSSENNVELESAWPSVKSSGKDSTAEITCSTEITVQTEENRKLDGISWIRF